MGRMNVLLDNLLDGEIILELTPIIAELKTVQVYIKEIALKENTGKESLQVLDGLTTNLLLKLEYRIDQLK